MHERGNTYWSRGRHTLEYGRKGEEGGCIGKDNFELNRRGSRDYSNNEGGDSPLLGLTKHTLAETKERATNSPNCKLNGLACTWKVYSRNRWCKKQMGHNISDGPNAGFLTKSNNNVKK